MTYDAVDLFAGPGGWDVAAASLGIATVGIEWDHAACLTATAAGHARVRADVAAYPPEPFCGIPGLIGSPSCTLFSMAGSGVGRLVLDVLTAGITAMLHGDDRRDEVRDAIYPVALAEREVVNAKKALAKRRTPEQLQASARTDAFIAALVLEPARWIVAMSPEWVALEQVPAVLPLWQAYVRGLRSLGYSAWAGVVNSADYGVPQTRRRCILMASRVASVAPPVPTHSPDSCDGDLFGNGREQWVSMATALGWGFDTEPSCTVSGGGGDTGGPEPFANGRYRARLAEYVVDRRTNSRAAGGTAAPTVPVPVSQPAPTFTGKSGYQWDIRPAWPHERPAATVVGSYNPDVIAAPGYRNQVSRQNAEGSVRVSVAEAGVLQSFPPDYPWQGSRTKQFQQVGNAVPPRLAAHVLAALTGAERMEVPA